MQRQKFVVDAMLGRLARWLRILGYDTEYDKNFEDWKILRIAKNSGRIIITRDRGLCLRAKKESLNCFYVPPDYDLVDVLAKLAKVYKIDLSVDFSVSRCPKDNGVLEKVSENKWRCVKCGQLYWRGKHWVTITQILNRAKAELESGNESSRNRGAEQRKRNATGQNSEENDSGEVRPGQAELRGVLGPDSK
ncbi:MAG: Mut7-C RNAse domain-containing protein [Thermoprotei archaeon]